MAQEHKGVILTQRLWLWFSFEEKDYYFLIFSFHRSGTRVKIRRWVQPLNTQCLEKFGRKWETECLTLGYPCLLCCVRDTMWSWLDFLYWINVRYTFHFIYSKYVFFFSEKKNHSFLHFSSGRNLSYHRGEI